MIPFLLHTGAYITDQEARNAYTEQMREKERLRESEKMDVGKLRNQYGRMRRLQHKAMLVFNADDFKDESYKVKNPPSAINHLFVDVHNVSAPPRARYRKPSNFPALKAPSKGGSTGLTPSTKTQKEASNKSKENKEKAKIIHESNTMSSGAKGTATGGYEKSTLKKQDSFSITNPYVMHEVQGNGDGSDATNDPTAHAHIMKNQTVPNKIRTAPKTQQQQQQLSAPIKKEANPGSDLQSTSPLYKVDKSALYPTNFKPFPKRNIGKRATLGNR